ncbi:hypothetical protein DFA_09120 [Cavenderia fasciculata]|uniref:Phosphoglycerate mutase family protein n=1 Tax=Cavenderia fasciculata TaxID=261658 RepID=F4Q6R3_CACFS|nr:uncharacterized protein DFA_09120 [Cavenderia fasciculata]EGG16573.1 hypothetical protein DFA_09120 [Cavenderia fasciculata]|eukprot:XP_004354973.1 hypothetical protein DFA_09120 [Cavenderia fasciculata]
MSDDNSVIYVTRHGLREDWANKEWRMTATRKSDPPLSSDGFNVAIDLGEECLKHRQDIKHILCSPMERCVQTATEIAKRLNLTIKLEYGCIEWLGPAPEDHLEPLSVDELSRLYPIDLSYKPSTTFIPHAESIQDLSIRTKKFVEYVKETYKGESVIIVTHAATLISICRNVINDKSYPFRSGVCSLTKFVHDSTTESQWKVDFAGLATYLRGGEQYHWTFPQGQ